jgi:hypothetical protein
MNVICYIAMMTYSFNNENTNTTGGDCNWNEALWEDNLNNLFLRLESFNI